MRKLHPFRHNARAALLAGCLCFLAARLPAQSPVAFDDYFTNAALRLELYEIGDAKEEIITEHGIFLEPVWPENPRSLIPPFEYGRYAIHVYDQESNRPIYIHWFNTMFGEYKTTKPALDGVKRAFEETLRIPCPKKPVKVVIERRESSNALTPLHTMVIDPADYHLIRETAQLGDGVFDVQNTGDPHERVDLVLLAEGYTAAEKDKFKADAERFANFMFTVEPYKGSKDKFNIRGVFRASPESGMDQPRQRSYKATGLNASFNAFDTDRYMLTGDSFAMHRMAAQVPYDSLVVLVNSTRYGGGSMCLDYCITTVDNAQSLKVFIHEFGHSFAFLADEYTGDVAYNDYYAKGVEPLDPNITELLDPKNIKWKALLSPGIAIPTVDTSRAEIQQLQAGLQAAQKEKQQQLADAKEKNAGEADLKAIEDKAAAKQAEIQAKLSEARAKATQLLDKVGAFEGAGYMTKGMYRPQLNCLMGQNPKNEFCAVCRQAIQTMIDYYAGGKQ